MKDLKMFMLIQSFSAMSHTSFPNKNSARKHGRMILTFTLLKKFQTKYHPKTPSTKPPGFLFFSPHHLHILLDRLKNKKKYFLSLLVRQACVGAMRDNIEQLVPDLHHGGTTPVTSQLLHIFQGRTPVQSLNNSAL